MDAAFAPNIIYAAGDFREIIPRYFFEWYYENVAHDDLQSKVEAEVNADSGKLAATGKLESNFPLSGENFNFQLNSRNFSLLFSL
jgi:hypothetical protein